MALEKNDLSNRTNMTRLSLLGLPAEIIQQILRALDPASFYVCLLTSKLFREHALQSKKILLDQIARVPGQRGLPAGIRKDPIALLRLFSKRAATHLLHGASQMVDIFTWKALPSMNRRLSSIVRWYNDEDCASGILTNICLLLEVNSNAGIVKIHTLRAIKGAEYHPRLTHTISPYLLSRYLPAYDWYGPEGYEIVRVAWKSVHVTQPPWENDHGPMLVVLFIPAYRPHHDMTLITMRLDLLHGPKVVVKYDIRPPLENETVAAMAIDTFGDPIITWRGARDNYKIVTYSSAVDDTETTSYLTETVNRTVSGSLVLPDRIADMRIRGNLALLYPESIPMPCLTANITIDDGLFEQLREATILTGILHVYRVGMQGHIIAHHHHHKIQDDELDDGEPSCVNTVLKLVICREEYQSHHGLALRSGIFIAKAVQYPAECEAFDPNVDYGRLQHLYVARLANTPSLANLSTIGFKMAVSPRAHRIALASWRTLKIYSLDPLALLSPEYSLSNKAGIAGDYAFVNACGWEYYSNGEVEEGCVILEPVEIECTGVVYGLMWRNEHELWGWGDEGLWRWNVGVWANCRRGASELGHCSRDIGLKRKRDIRGMAQSRERAR